MFDIQFLRKYPGFAVCEGVQLTLLPPRMRPKPLDEVIRDDEELDTRIKSEKKKIPESPEAVVFAKVHLPPHVWFELPAENDVGVQIRDAVPEDYTSIIDLLMEHFLPVEPLCKAMHLQDDQEGVRELIHQFMYYVGGTTSLVAVDGQNTLVGVLIGKIEDADECSEKAFRKTELDQLGGDVLIIWEKLNSWVSPTGVEKALITAALKICSVFNVWRVAGTFTMYKDQYYMKQFGAKTELEVYYSEWRTDRGLRIFRGTGKTEPKVSFMTAPVPESFLTSSEESPPLEPLTSERARRFINKRLYLWDELDINRACPCLAKPIDTRRHKQRRMKKSRNLDQEGSVYGQSLFGVSSSKKCTKTF